MKRLTSENWLEPERVMLFLWQRGPGGGEARPMPGEDLIAPVMVPALVESVPEEVRGLFETGRGALVYGYFF